MAHQHGVTVTFEIQCKPEFLEERLQNPLPMLEATSTFPGYRYARVVQNKDDPTRLLFIEQWDSEEDYRNYIKWRTEAGFMEKLKRTTISTETRIWPNLVVERSATDAAGARS